MVCQEFDKCSFSSTDFVFPLFCHCFNVQVMDVQKVNTLAPSASSVCVIEWKNAEITAVTYIV